MEMEVVENQLWMEPGICWGCWILRKGELPELSILPVIHRSGIFGRKSSCGVLALSPAAPGTGSVCLAGASQPPQEYTGKIKSLAFPSEFSGELLLMQESDRVWGPVTGLINPQGLSGSSQRERSRIHKSRQNKLSTLGQENIEKSVGFL